MAEPSIGDSKKKSLAVTAITALAALHTPETTLYVIGGIALIAVVGMGLFALLEYPKKNK